MIVITSDGNDRKIETCPERPSIQLAEEEIAIVANKRTLRLYLPQPGAQADDDKMTSLMMGIISSVFVLLDEGDSEALSLILAKMDEILEYRSKKPLH